MRDIIIIIVILIIVFVGGFFSEKYLSNSGGEIVSKLDKIEKNIEMENFNDKNKIKDIEDSWNSIKDNWNIIANHNAVDEVENDIMEFIQNYENADKDECLINIKVIKNKVTDIPKGEKFNLVNIL